MYFFIGITLICFAIFAGHWLERKAFYRRNGAGLEEHASYSALVKTRMEECLFKALGVLAALSGVGFIVAGIW